MIGSIANWIVRRADQKAQTNREKYLRSTIRQFDGAGRYGAVHRPVDMNGLLGRFRSWVYACAMLNAKAVSSIPLRLYVRKDRGRAAFATRAIPRRRMEYLCGDSPRRVRPAKSVMMHANQGDRFEEVLEHPLLDLLRDVNPLMDGFNFTVLRMLFLQITGNEYVHPVVNKLGMPVELWIMPSQYVQIIPDRDEMYVAGYVYGRPPDEDVYEPDEVLHQKIPDPRDLFYGRGWVEAAASAIDLLSSMDEYELALFDNQARPDWGIFIQENLTDGQWDRMLNQIDKQLRGNRKSGRPYVFEGGSDAKPLQFSPKDLAFASGEERKIEAVAAIAGVPVSKLKANDPNLSNAELGDYGWMKDTIQPYAVADEEWLNQQLVPMFDQHDQGLFLAYDDPVPQDVERTSRIDVSEVSSGIKTINEARGERGLPPEQGGEVLRVGGIPLDEMGQPGPDPLAGLFGPRQEEREPMAIAASRAALPAPQSHKAIIFGLWTKAPQEDLPSRSPDDTGGEVGGFRTSMRDIFARQVAALANDPDAWRSILGSNAWVDEIAEAARPFVARAVDLGGAAGEGALPSPVGFDVTNPNVQSFADRWSVRLANSVQESTTHTMSRILGDGLERGESVSGLVDRVREWGGSDVSGARAEMIARTESARAYVAGEELAWDQSGVVTGKQWLLAPNPCEFCRATANIFNKRGPVKLGGNFFARGHVLTGADGGRMKLDYSDVTGPPLHPHCRCDLIPILEA